MFDKTQLVGYQSAQNIDTQISDKEKKMFEQAYKTGLYPAEGIKEPGITTFARGSFAPTFISKEALIKGPSNAICNRNWRQISKYRPVLRVKHSFSRSYPI